MATTIVTATADTTSPGGRRMSKTQPLDGVILELERFGNTVKLRFALFPERLRGVEAIGAAGGFPIGSVDHPALETGRLYCPGSDRLRDNDVVERTFDYEVSATEALRQVREAVTQLGGVIWPFLGP